ncbi:MAG: hypothetical protein ACI9BV_003870 [Rhodothermales bacterium]|jgi:hypothetical protein
MAQRVRATRTAQRVENLTLPITVLRCDYSKRSHTSYLFTIFHRLNTGAVKLNNQEIRNCIFTGELNDLLFELNKDPDWLILNRMRSPTGNRFRGQELILRLFALADGYSQYGGRLAKYLNDYMAGNRNPLDSQVQAKRVLFKRVLAVVFKSIYGSEAPERGPMSVLEATLVGVTANIEVLEGLPPAELRRRQHRMLSNDEFSSERLSEGLSGKERLIGRLDAAISAFGQG